MSSSHPNSQRRLYDASVRGPHSDVLVEVKRTSIVRDPRDALLELSYHANDRAFARALGEAMTRIERHPSASND